MKKLYTEFSSDYDLFQAYMPFLKEGGLFIRTSEAMALGTEVELEVFLPDSLEQSKVTGVVCWHTPVGSQNGTPPGVGVSFVDDPDKMRYQIEKTIARHLSSSEATLTM